MSEMDKFLRNKLYDHPSQLSEDMWSRIEAGMKSDKKNRKALWFILPGILLAVLFFTFLFKPEILKPSFVAEIKNTHIAKENKASFTPDEANNHLENNAIKTSSANNGDISSMSTLTSYEENADFLNMTAGSHLASTKAEWSTNLNQTLEITESLTNEENLAIENKASLNDPMTARKSMDYPLLNTKVPMYLDIPESLFKDPIGCPTMSSRKSSNLFIEGYAGPLYAQKLLGVNSSEVGEGYLERRRETENSLFSWNAGVNIGWISDYNVGVQSGLNYEVINERFVYEDSVAVRSQTVITIDTIFNADGSQTINSDTSIQQVFGYETQRIHNYHQTINIPIFLLYQVDFDKIDIEFSGGPILNIAYFNRGKIVDPSDNDRWFTNTANGAYRVFKDKLSLSLSLSVSVLYSVNEHIQLFARPNVKYHLNSMTTATSPFNQRYFNAGISFGARYYISGNPNY